MCHLFCECDHRPDVGVPSHTAPQHEFDASVITTVHLVTSPSGTPRVNMSVSYQSLRVLTQLCVTKMRIRPEVYALHGTRVFSHNCSGRICSSPRWQTDEDDAISPRSLRNSLRPAWSEAAQRSMRKDLQHCHRVQRFTLHTLGRQAEIRTKCGRGHRCTAMVSPVHWPA